MTPRALDSSLVGHYAGPVTRAAAFGIDVAISLGVFTLLAAGATYILNLVTSTELNDLGWYQFAQLGLFVLWMLLYWGYSWAVAGKTPGKGIAGLVIVRSDGSPLDRRHALKRLVFFPLSFVLFGLGFWGVVFGRRHQAWHDHLADTAVVYDWDARAARWRFLARGRTAAMVPAAGTGEGPDARQREAATTTTPAASDG